MNRRTLLASAGAAVTGLATTDAVDAQSTDHLRSDEVPSGNAVSIHGAGETLELPPAAEAFADVPRLEEPTPTEREIASVWFPPSVVPESGPIPDPHHMSEFTGTIELPPWVLYAVHWYTLRQQRGEGSDTRPGDVADAIYQYFTYDPTYVDQNGVNVVDVLAADP